MERKPPSSLGDIVAVLQRRKYWILIPSVLLIAAGLALTPLVPRTYQSTTTIMVEAQNVPSVYVRSSDNNQEVMRLEKINLQVMSGAGFPQIIEKFDLYPKMRKKATMAHVIATMRHDISVEEVPDAGDGRGGVLAFTISYIGTSPQQARDVTMALADLFIQENEKQGRQRTEGAYDFLTAQLNTAGQRLAAQQAKIQAYRASHVEGLPEQAQANMQTINQYQTAMQANEDALGQANQQRVYLQSVLNVKSNGAQGLAAPPPATPLQIELAKKQQELSADLLKYTPEHPDVIRLKHDIAALKVEIKDAPEATSATAALPTPQVNGPTLNDQLRSQLIALNADIKAREERQKVLEARLAQLQGSVGGSPAVQTEFAALNSDYEEMQKNYNALLEQQQEAGMATALDQRAQSQQFLVAQQANLPMQPFRPNPMLLDLAVVLIGLLVGFLCALVVEIGDDTMHDSEEVAAYLKLPVMVALPKCVGIAEATWETNAAKS
ncbi:MAG: Wzz/FepE/Etk N-terminal domain-containing protein [Acidobacteriaceae bacterium]